jgi:hypothetical protein
MREVAEVALECRESREDLALNPERWYPIRQALFRLGKDLEDCGAERVEGAPLRLIQRRKVLIDLPLGHGAESCSQERSCRTCVPEWCTGSFGPRSLSHCSRQLRSRASQSGPDRREGKCQQARECSGRRILIVTGRVRRGPRSIIVTDGHEAEAMAALRSTRHGRLGRLFLELVGWPVARPKLQAGNPGPSHLHPVRQEHAGEAPDPVCSACGTRHRTERPPPSDG